MDNNYRYSVNVDPSNGNSWELGDLLNDISSWPLNKVKTVEAFLNAVAPFIPAGRWGKTNTIVITDPHDTEAVFTLNRVPTAVVADKVKGKK